MKNIIKIALILALVGSIFGIFTLSSSAAKEPTAGYAVWATKEDYLANPDKPLIVSSSAELSTSIGSNRYVVCYGDVTLKAGIAVTNGSELTIDLGGHTLTATSSITVGANANYTPTNFTIKNGTVIHTSGQFMKAQPNSRVLFDGITLIERASSLFYSDGVRLVYFKDSKLIFEKTDKSGSSMQIYPLLNSYLPKIAALEGVKTESFKYEHNIVFDNTQVVGGDFTSAMILIPARGDAAANYSVTFTSGAGFDKLDKYFIQNNNSEDGMYVKVNIIKGASFANPEVPVKDDLDSSIDLSFYNKAEFDGVKMLPSEMTSLAEENEEQLPGQTPKLIFGASGNQDAPYRLCNFLSDVTFITGGVSETFTGYADGLTVSYEKDSRGYYFDTDENGNERVYLDVHSGWRAEGSDEVLKTVTLTEKSHTFYAAFEDVGPAVLVEFASSEMREDEILNAYMEKDVDGSFFESVKAGSYLYLYEDATLDISSAVEISGGGVITLDLGGHTLERFEAVESSLTLFKVSGGELVLKNGQIRTGFAGVAELNDLATLTVMNLDCLYGSVPAFFVNNGVLILDGSALRSRSDSTTSPAVMLATDGGHAEAYLSDTAVDISGPLFSHTSDGGKADITAVISDSDDVKVGSVFSVSSASVNISPETTVKITASGSDITCKSVFDIPKRADGEPLIDLTAEIKSGSFSADPRLAEVNLILDSGKSIVATASGYTVAESGFSVKYSMSLKDSFTAKFYIPVDSQFVSVISYAGETAREELNSVSLDGEEYYVFEISGISVSNALDKVKLGIRFTLESGEYVADLSYSPIDYFKTLLNSDDTLTAKLSAAAVRYVAAAYEYSGCPLPKELCEVLGSEEYQSRLRDLSEVIVKHTEADLGNISEVFTGAQLYLSSTLSVRFNIRSGYTGKVTVAGVEYDITDGKSGELTYVQVTPTAYDLYKNKIGIVGAGISGEYSLDSYISHLADSDEKLSLMLEALRAFCYEAYVFDIGGVVPPYVEHTPTVDVNHRFG